MEYQVNNRLPWLSCSSDSKLTLARCETTPKKRPLGDYTEIVVIDSNATKMKLFHYVTRAREIPLHVKLDLLQSFLWTAAIAPTLSFPFPQRRRWKAAFPQRRWKAAFPQHYFPDLRTSMGASLVWLGAGSKLMRWEEIRNTFSKGKEVWARLSCHSNNSTHIPVTGASVKKATRSFVLLTFELSSMDSPMVSFSQLWFADLSLHLSKLLESDFETLISLVTWKDNPSGGIVHGDGQMHGGKLTFVANI